MLKSPLQTKSKIATNSLRFYQDNTIELFHVYIPCVDIPHKKSYTSIYIKKCIEELHVPSTYHGLIRHYVCISHTLILSMWLLL